MTDAGQSAAGSRNAGQVKGGHPGPVVTPVQDAAGRKNTACLTFDDGPNAGDTTALLDILAARNIRAVFCVVGERIQAPGGIEVLRRMVAEGHVLANHSMSFADMGAWSPDRVRADMTRTLDVIRSALESPTHLVPYWRAPNGSWGVTPQVAVELGMQPLAVTGVIGDWETQDVEVLTERLRTVMTPGSVVLAHDGGGERAGTVEAVRRVVDERLSLGWRFTLPAR